MSVKHPISDLDASLLLECNFLYVFHSLLTHRQLSISYHAANVIRPEAGLMIKVSVVILNSVYERLIGRMRLGGRLLLTYRMYTPINDVSPTCLYVNCFHATY